MELANYELIRYPSGQLILTRTTTNAQGAPSSGPRDVVGVFASEAEAQSALARLDANSGMAQMAPQPAGSPFLVEN